MSFSSKPFSRVFTRGEELSMIFTSKMYVVDLGIAELSNIKLTKMLPTNIFRALS